MGPHFGENITDIGFPIMGMELKKRNDRGMEQ